jgi:hypothetical protein
VAAQKRRPLPINNDSGGALGRGTGAVRQQDEAGQLLNFCSGAAATRTGAPLQVYPEAVGRMEILDGMLHPERKSRLPILP